MAIIKQMNGTTSLKKVLPNKIPFREKWEQYKKRVAQRLNDQTKQWNQKQKKRFLILFSIGFITLLTLSFCFLTRQDYEGKSVTVPTLPEKLLLPEKQVLKTLIPPNQKKLPPPLMDSSKHKL